MPLSAYFVQIHQCRTEARRFGGLNNPARLCTHLFTSVGAHGHRRKGYREEGNRGVTVAMIMMEYLQI